MVASRTRKQSAPLDPSALDALLEAERAVAQRLNAAEREATALVEEARAQAARADDAAARDLEAELERLSAEAARQRDEDARAIRVEAEHRRRLYADADPTRVAAIADRIAAMVAPEPATPPEDARP